MAEPASSELRITLLDDAFGKNPAIKLDWGDAALVEVGGKRILLDTGNDSTIFAQNVKAARVDLTRLDFVVMLHRHGGHMGGRTCLLSVNLKVKIYSSKKGFGVHGGNLPSKFDRRAESVPAEMRCYMGKPDDLLKFGKAWPTANIELIDKSIEVAPGVTLIAQVSDLPGAKELKELSLAINTPEGLVLVVGCSHPGIGSIVAEGVKINPHVRLIAGGFHLVVAKDPVIEKVAMSLRDTYKVD